jgi:hypothetical protein
MKILRGGATRVVILVGSLAVKIPSFHSWRSFLRGLLANMQEREWWRYFRDEKLCPVRGSIPGGWLVIMSRCEPLDEPLSTTEYLEFIDGNNLCLPVEHKGSSFGVLRGRIVTIDYGS